MILVSSCSCLFADRRCSNYIWVIDNFIANLGASYIRYLKVCTMKPIRCASSPLSYFSHLGFLLQSTRSIICSIDNVTKHWSVDIRHTLTHKYISYIHMVLGDWLIMLCCHSEQKYDLCIIERQWKSLVEDIWLPASHCCRVCVIAVVHNIILNS